MQLLWKTAWWFLKNLKITTIWSRSSSPRYRTKRTEGKDANRYFHTHVIKSTIPLSQNVEATQVSVDRWVSPPSGVLFCHRKQWHTLQCGCVLGAACRVKAARHKKDHPEHDSVYVKWREQAKPQRREAGRWLPGPEGRGWEWLLTGTESSGIWQSLWLHKVVCLSLFVSSRSLLAVLVSFLIAYDILYFKGYFVWYENCYPGSFELHLQGISFSTLSLSVWMDLWSEAGLL